MTRPDPAALRPQPGRTGLDLWSTPPCLIRALTKSVLVFDAFDAERFSVWEPGAGDGAIADALTANEWNVVATDRRLIESPGLLRSQRGLETLASATGTTAPMTLGVKDIEDAGALTEAQKLVKTRVQENSTAGGKQLDGAGVSFDRWCAIVTALDAGQDPAIETQEAEPLVKRGLVHRTYRLGARS